MSEAEARTPFRHRLEYLAFRVGRAFVGLLPEPVGVAFGAALGLMAGSVLRIRRATVDENLRVAFPDESRRWRDRVARRSYVHLGREAVFLLRMSGWPAERIRQRLEVVNGALAMDAAAAGDGVVILTGHVGNWEVAGAGSAALGLSLDVVGKGMANRRFEGELFAAREGLGMRVIEMTEAPRQVLRSLGQQRVVAMLGDQNAHRWGVFIPFFGKLAATPRGTAVLALRKGCPVLFGFAVRRPGWRQTYHLEFRTLDFQRTGELEADVVAILEAYHGRLEDVIRQWPEQYFWQHKRWKTRPPEEPPPEG